MIIKIKSHKRAAFGRVLNYMLHNKDRLFDKERRSFAITHNIKGKTIARWEKQFKENETHRRIKRKDSVILTHEILSWHRDDAKNITLAKLEDMAREYMRLRNPNGMYVAVPHFDKDHCHIHICASGVEYKTGRSLRLSRADLQKLKVEIQKYQIEKFPELSKSVVEHGKKDKSLLTDKEYQIKLRTGRETEKEQVSAALKTCYKASDSREAFFDLLRQCGLTTYERGGKISGVIRDGRKFRLNRLGYTEERIKDLDKANLRGREIKEVRNKEVTRSRGSEILEVENTEENNSRESELSELRSRGSDDKSKGREIDREEDEIEDEDDDKETEQEIER